MCDLLPPVPDLLALLSEDSAAVVSVITYLLEHCDHDPFLVARQSMVFTHILNTGVRWTCKVEKDVLLVKNKDAFSKLLLHFSFVTSWSDAVSLAQAIINPGPPETSKASGCAWLCIGRSVYHMTRGNVWVQETATDLLNLDFPLPPCISDAMLANATEDFGDFLYSIGVSPVKSPPPQGMDPVTVMQQATELREKQKAFTALAQQQLAFGLEPMFPLTFGMSQK